MSDDKSFLKPIAKRLVEIRGDCGYANRATFAQDYGAPLKTFEKYEQGLSELPTKLLLWLQEKHNVNLTWLMTGIGPKLATQQQSQSQTLFIVEVNPWAMERLYVLVETVYGEIGRPITGNAIAREAAGLFNDLARQAHDLRNQKDIEDTLPKIASDLRKRLIEAQPGSGKRSAS